MAPSPIPAPLPAWARALIQILPLIPAGLQEVLEYIGDMGAVDAPAPGAWMHVQLVGQPVGSTERADDFVTTFDIANITNGAIDSTWNQADLDTVHGHLANLATSWCSRMSNDYKWREMRFYRRYFNPYSLEKPFAPVGPPVTTYPLTPTGSGTTYQAPQVAVTTTDRTAYPRHWGRNYWPHPHGNTVNTGGYMSSTTVDALATLVHDIYALLMAAEFFPVVPVTQRTEGETKIATRGLLTVTEVQVDNLFDVMRSRRPKKPTYRKTMPL